MDQNEELFQEMNYLNIKEYQGSCDRHKIPYHIHILVDGRPKKTTEKLRLFLNVQSTQWRHQQ